MLRMEIALFFVLAFVAYIYFSAEWRTTLLHKVFSVLLIAMMVHLLFDAATIYTVNHLSTVPILLNDILHRFFIGTMVLIVYLFYQYICFCACGFWFEAGSRLTQKRNLPSVRRL